jgi:hypothetical protein
MFSFEASMTENHPTEDVNTLVYLYQTQTRDTHIMYIALKNLMKPAGEK